MIRHLFSSRFLPKWLVVLIFFTVFFTMQEVAITKLAQNLSMSLMNYAMSDPNLTYIERQDIFMKAKLWGKRAGTNGPAIVARIDTERRELKAAYMYLSQNDEFVDFMPGRQLIMNPYFENNAGGWIEYRSTWQSTTVQFPNYTGSAIVFSHSGPGHGALSQIIPLATDACYFFKATGAAERQDEIPTIWLYWERFENGIRQGRNLISGSGDQPWQQRMGVFCLPISDNSIEEVVLAPVNVYGNVIVYLETTRLYELQPLP